MRLITCSKSLIFKSSLAWTGIQKGAN